MELGGGKSRIRNPTSGGGTGTVGTVDWGPDFGDVSDDNTFTVSGTLVMTEAILDYNPLANGQGQIGDPEWSVNDLATTKDCFIIQGSAVNQNGLNLVVQDAIAGDSESYIFFPLNIGSMNLPDNVTLLSGSLAIVVAIIQAGSNNIDTFKIADANEGWSETGIDGTNEPAADGAVQQQFNVPNLSAAGAVITVSLNATWLASIQAKINGNIAGVTFLLRPNTANGLSTFRDRENGANTPARLTLLFSTPA